MISHAYLVRWLHAFVFTLVVEVPVFVLVVRGTVPAWRAALAGAAGSFLTHPLLWFVWPRVIRHDYAAYIVSGELIVSVVETFTFFLLAGGLDRAKASLANAAAARRLTLVQAVAASFLANAASYGGGKVAYMMGWLR